MGSTFGGMYTLGEVPLPKEPFVVDVQIEPTALSRADKLYIKQHYNVPPSWIRYDPLLRLSVLRLYLESRTTCFAIVDPVAVFQ